MATTILSFNVQDYGALGDGIHDDAPAFQKCADALAAAQGNSVGEIYVPPTVSSYLLVSPLFLDHNNQKLVGGGAGASLFSAWDGLYVGVKRFKPSPLHFADAFGALDTSVAPTKGYRFGLRSGGDTTAQFQSNGLQYGARGASGHDYWSTSQQLTIEFMVNFPGTVPAGIQPFGLGTWQNPSPWAVLVDGNDPHVWHFTFTTQGDRQPRGFTFTSPTIQGPFRVTIQIDLAHATCVAFINDVRVATTYGDWASMDPSGYSKPWGPGLFFKANDSVPFIIGQAKIDQTIYGLHISNTLRYPDPGVGNKMATPPNDASRYFTPIQSTIGLLPLDQTQNGSQQVPVMQIGNVKSMGLITPIGGGGYSSNITLENLNIQGSWYAGAGLWIGTIFNVTLKKLTVTGFTGVTSFITACTYNVTIEDCNFAGLDCNYFGYFQIIRATNLDFAQAGRDVMRLVSCDMNLLNCFIGGPSTDTVFKFLAGGYGCAIRMTNVIIDFEGYAVNKAIVYCENQPYVPSTTLALVDFFIGTIGNVPAILLADCGKPGIWGKGWFTAENVSTWGPYTAFVQTDGPLWGGVVNAYFLNPKLLHKHVPTWGPTSPMQFTNVQAAP